jgi:hypothetical protein
MIIREHQDVQQSIMVLKQHKDDYSLAVNYNNLGIVTSQFEESDKANSVYFEKSFGYFLIKWTLVSLNALLYLKIRQR